MPCNVTVREGIYNNKVNCAFKTKTFCTGQVMRPLSQLNASEKVDSARDLV